MHWKHRLGKVGNETQPSEEAKETSELSDSEHNKVKAFLVLQRKTEGWKHLP